MQRLSRFIIALGVMAVAGMGCGGGAGAGGSGGSGGAGGEGGAGIPDFVGGVSGFGLNNAVFEAYWYSRYNLGSFVMKSGAGVEFMPDMTMVGNMVTSQTDSNSMAAAPTNAYMLKRVYDSADPLWLNPPVSPADPMNFLGERWQVPTVTTTSGASFGWVAIKELEWARQFHVDGHFGVPNSTTFTKPGAQQRFVGLILFVETKMQADEWINNPGDFTTTDLGGQYVAMEALVDLSAIISVTTLGNSASNRYRMLATDMGAMMNPVMSADQIAMRYMTAADALYNSLATPTSIANRDLALQSLSWYAAFNATNRAAAKTKIASIGDSLAAATRTTTLDHAHAVRGLLEAHRVLGTGNYNAEATTSFNALKDDFDWAYGVFSSKNAYSADDIAVIYGAINSIRLNGDVGLGEDADIMLTRFFEAVVNMSGMQQAAPPVAMLPTYEQMSSELMHRYEGMPMPPMAGGTYGRAPVLAKSVTWNPTAKTWSLDPLFDTAGAFHLANEMLWTHSDEVTAYPLVP